MIKKIGLTLGLALLSSTALADQPVLKPQTGFEGDAVINDSRSGQHMTVRIHGEGDKFRSEMSPQPGMSMTSVINFKTGKSIMWMKGGPMAQMGNYYFETKLSNKNGPMNMEEAAKNADFTKKGTKTIAGETCTLWHGQPKDGSKGGTSCITDDGLHLSHTPDGETQPVFEVTRFTRGDQDDALFAPPPGSQPSPFQLPGNMGGGGMPPGMMGPQ